jgi:uncharacterized protein (DUF2062 family)
MPEAAASPERGSWLTRHVPTRDTVHHFRLLRPFAPYLAHNSLWRLNRRSVPRGVALGLFVAVMIPVMHTVIAALLAIPTRANVMIAAAVTIVVNPLTMGPLYWAAYRIGSWELHHDAHIVSQADAARFSGELSRALFWAHHATGPIALGILTLASLLAIFGYLAATAIWRVWSSNRWRQRRISRESVS